jgi:hypothetical protein
MDNERESSDCSTTNLDQSEREEASPAMRVSAIGLAMDNSLQAGSSESLAAIVDEALEMIEDVTVQEHEALEVIEDVTVQEDEVDIC